MSPMESPLEVPSFADILDARRRIQPYLAPTPLFNYPAVDELIGARVYIKHENTQNVGAFKVRGGVNLISRLSAEERSRGVIGASTGNHGQSIAYAARLFGVPAVIAVPEGANPGKVAAMTGMGATVIHHGQSFDEARMFAETYAVEKGFRYIHSGDEPLLIAGVATLALEMFEAHPDLDILFVPVGGGSGAAGASLVAHHVRPAAKVIGVQSEAAPAAYRTWKEGRAVQQPSRTMAEGLATGVPFALPQMIMARYLDDFVLVSDQDIMRAMIHMIERAHTLAEAAGAAPLAAAYQGRDQLRGLSVGLVCSGGNSSLEHLRMALNQMDEANQARA